MPLSFPSSPTVGQQSTQNGRVYIWTGSAWELATQVDSHTHSASDVVSGTLSDSRLTDKAQAAINIYLWSTFR